MPNVDDSIVRIQLDDSQFDKASDKTIRKLDELKRSLQFDGAVESFNEIEKAAKRTDFSPMEKGIEAVSIQFNALATIADATFRRIINKGIDAAESTLKGLTIDNVTAGWSKYADKTAAVQTIMAATAKQFSDTGEQMEYVEGQLEKLNWFTDETSYSFLDMVNNIGKFTSNNIALDESVTAMQGISTWAAISGATVNEAGRAMYNLSQAMATGALKLQDWMSIENANMGTAQFKEIAIEAAVALGTVKEVGKGVYQTLEGTEVSASKFRDTLSEGWLNADVLMATLSKYGEFTNKLYEFSELTGLSATPILGYLEDYTNGVLDMQEIMDDTGLSAEVLIEWLDLLSDSELELGNRAFRAAQEAKTFQEAIDATKEAVASGWMQSFEHIFGNYEEAKEIWSELAEGLYDVFVESGNTRNELLKDWKALGGRTYLLDGIRTALSNLANAVAFVKEVFEDIFPPKTAEELVYMTEGFKKLMEDLKPSENTINAIRNSLTLLFKVFQKTGEVALVVVAGLEPIWVLIGQITGAIISLIGYITELLGFSLDEIFSSDALTNLYNIIYTISSIIAALARGALAEVVNILAHIYTFINNIWSTFRANGGGVKGFVEAIVVNFKDLFNTIKNGNSIINSIFNTLKNGVELVLGAIILGISTIFEKLTGSEFSFDPIINFFADFIDGLDASTIATKLGTIGGAMVDFVSDMFTSMNGVEGIIGNLKKAMGWLFNQVEVVWKWFVVELGKLGIKDIADISLIIMLDRLLGSFDKFVQSGTKITNGIAKLKDSFEGVLNSFSGLLKSFSNRETVFSAAVSSLSTLAGKTQYLQMAAGIIALTNSLVMLSEIPTDKLGTAVGSVLTILGLLTLMQKTLKTTTSTSKKGTRPTDIMNAMFRMSLGITALAVGLKLLASSVPVNIDQETGKIDIVGLVARIGSLVIALLAINALMGEMVMMVQMLDALNLDKSFKKVASGISVMAAGILLLSVSVALLSLIPWKQLLAGVASVAALMLAFGAAAWLMKDVKVASILSATSSVAIMAVGISAMIVPILALAAVTKALGDTIDINDIMNKILLLIGALSVSMVAIGRFAGGVGGAASIATSALAMVSFAATIAIVAAAIKAFMDIPVDVFNKGLILLSVTLGGFIALSIVAGFAATGLLSLSAILIAVAAAFALFAAGISAIADAAATFTLVGTTLVMVGEQLGEEFPQKLEAAMKNIEMVIRSFLKLIVNVSGDIAGAVIAVLLAINGGLVYAAPWIVETILFLGTVLFNTIAELGPGFIEALTKMIKGLTPGIPALLESFAEFIFELTAGIGIVLHAALLGVIKAVLTAVFGKEFADSIIGGFDAQGDQIVKGFKTAIGKSLMSGVNGDDLPKKFENFGETLMKAFGRGIDGVSIEDKMKAIKEKIIGAFSTGANGKSILDIFKGIGEGIGGTLQSIGDAFESFVERIKNLFSHGANGKSIQDSVKETTDGMAETLKASVEDESIPTAFGGLRENIFSAITTDKNGVSVFDKAFEIGGNIISGLTNGMKKTIGGATSIGESAGSGAIEGMRDGAGTHSPSWKAADIATDIFNGFSNMFDGYLPSFEDMGFGSMFSFFNGMLEGANEGGSFMSSALDSFYQMIGAKTKDIEERGSAHTRSRELFDTRGFSEEDLRQIAEDQARTKEESFEIGDDIGTFFNDALSEAISSGKTSTGGSVSKTATEKVKTVAEEVEEAYKFWFDKLDMQEKTINAEYSLWEALNIDLSDVEKKTKELDHVNEQVEIQVERAKKAEFKYNELVEKLGKDATETKEAYIDMLEEQTDLAKLRTEIAEIQNEIVELQTTTIDDLRKELNQMEDTADLEYELWEAMNQDANEAVKKAKEIEYQTAKLVYQGQQLALAEREWKEAAEDSTKTAEEINELHNAWLREQIDYVEIQNTLTELQKDTIDKNDEMLKQLEASMTRREKGYELWNKLNQDATEAQQSLVEMQKLNADLANQIDQANVYALKWQEAIWQYGKDSEESIEAMYKYYDALSAALDYQNEIKDRQLSVEDEQAEARKRYTDLVVADIQSENSVWDSLRNLGFDEDEIRGYFEEQAGIVREATQEEIDTTLETTMAAAQEQLKGVGLVMIEDLNTWTPNFAEVGTNYVNSIVDGVENSTENVIDSTDKMIDDIVYACKRQEVSQEWVDIGYQIDMGIVKGIEDGESEVINRVIAMVKAAVSAAKAAAGIASPSKETIWMGKMLDEGLIVGIERNAAAVATASARMIEQSLRQVRDMVGTSNNLEFVGRLIAGGISAGMETYSYQILSASDDLIERTINEFDQQLEKGRGYLDLLAELGFDEEELSLDLVINLDDSKAYEELTDLEKALTDYREATYNRDRAKRYISEYESALEEGYRDVSVWNSRTKSWDWVKESDKSYQKRMDALNDGLYEWQELLGEYSAQLREAKMAINSAVSSSTGDSVSRGRISYVQNIYSTKPLSTLDIYRNTNKQLLQFS